MACSSSVSGIGSPAKLPQAIGVAVGEVGRDLDPLPALGADRLGRVWSFSATSRSSSADVLQPAAVVALEEVAHDRAAGVLIGVDADELGALVGGADRAFGQHAPDGVGFLGVGLAKPLEYLLLALVVAVDGERHELVERHAVLGIDVEQLRRDGGEPQTLLHHGGGDEEAAAISSSDWPFSRRAWKARNWSSGCSGARWTFSASESSSAMPPSRTTQGTGRGLGQALLLDQQFERPVAAAAGRDLEHAGLLAFGVEDRPDGEALQQRAPGDVLGQLLDRDAGLDAPDVRLAQDQLVEGDVARGAEGDLLNGGSHVGFSATGAERPLSTSNPSRKPGQPSHSLERRSPASRGRRAQAAFRRPRTATSGRLPLVRRRRWSADMVAVGWKARDSRLPSTRRSRRARWRDCPRAAPRARNRDSRRGAPSARCRARRTRRRWSFRRPALPWHRAPSRTRPTGREPAARDVRPSDRARGAPSGAS